ncbi:MULTISPECIES: integrase core domain-containing protein [Nitrosomonas]|uniref:integrase core domain-containing protein n=1 Tax=Nitrosomonas TaxID=914 RepID=UPI0009E26143|nr:MULTISPECIES: integrase core domain-containing protein [Nitrosomonas]UVS62913.1 integrase core domain-containing protein [Nitrosomonas sp. PLL12]
MPTREFNNLKEIKQNLSTWFEWYNQERFHQSLDRLTPDEIYYSDPRIDRVA